MNFLKAEWRKLAIINYEIDPKILEKYLPKGKDEYHLRNLQNKSGISYRNLSAYEIEVLVRNNNTNRFT